MKNDETRGQLTLASLPIGNLGDITYRSLEVLRSADYILAEDTRELVRLAKMLDTTLPQIRSYRDQTHERVLPSVLADLAEGQNVVLVSDRGTPTISDPGYKLVRDVQDAGFAVTAAPGVTAAMMALSISGLPTDRFTFLGFLPRSAGKQQKLIQQFAELPATFIVYESPFRVAKLLQNIETALGGDTEVAAISELTKLHEKVLRGPVSEILAQLKDKKLKGEWVVLGRAN